MLRGRWHLPALWTIGTDLFLCPTKHAPPSRQQGRCAFACSVEGACLWFHVPRLWGNQCRSIVGRQQIQRWRAASG
jgi:hypothetical protein